MPVMKPKYPEQAEELSRALELLGMTKEALAEKIAISPDTLRRGIAGSQKMSEAVMQSVRNLVSMAQYFSPGRKSTSDRGTSGTQDGQRLGMLLTEEEREGLLYMVREKTDEEIIQQIEETLKDKTISKSTRFSSARLWLEVLEKRQPK